mmetsp:Transcript_38054/g.79331  ORF Transcript_38054/g.79331 Transcript_38054/m.79331 type:complete len:113 (-) Transcript_38054:758-1096(-)
MFASTACFLSSAALSRGLASTARLAHTSYALRTWPELQKTQNHLDGIRRQELGHWNSLLDASHVVVDKVPHDQKLHQLRTHHPVSHEGLDVVIWVGELAKRAGPENEAHQLG